MQFNVLDVAPSISDPFTSQWQIDLRPDTADTIPVWTKNTNGTWTDGVFTTTAPGEHALAVFEGLDNYGRLFPHLGTVNEGSLLWAEDPGTGVLVEGDQPGNPGVGFAEAAAAETVVAGVYTLFEVYNTTPDAHPIHLHGTEFQVLERQKIAFTLVPDPGGTAAMAGEGGAFLTSTFADTNGDLVVDTNDITLIGKATPAAAYESGFKDTAIVNPGERVLVVAIYDAALLSEDVGFAGAGNYVWHCHILSHEDHEMMRPLKLVAAAGP